MDEVNLLRAKFSQRMENGKRIESFTSTAEWHWYVDSVIQPTIEEYTNKLLEGKFDTDREDWALRGMINGLKMVIDSTGALVEDAAKAKEQARKLEEDVKNAE